MSTRTAILVAASSAMSICMAQSGPETSVDRVSNWPAPLYWQAYPASSAPASHHGRSREQAAMKAVPTTPATPSVFVAISPCRVMDTRYSSTPPSGRFGAPAFVATEIRTIAIPSGPCPVPSNAVAYSLNIAVVPNPPGSPMRWLTAWDTGNTQPNAATLNDKAGLVTSNSAIVPAGSSGSIDVFVTDATNVIIDINGYYAPPNMLPLTGTAAAPALTFGDTATGLYSDSAGSVSIATGGTNRITVTADGNLELPGSITKRGTLFLHGLNTQDTGVGFGALAVDISTTGQNSALGYAALQSNITGFNNTATGAAALQSNTSATDNTAVGYAALQDNTTGGSNTAVGSKAVKANVSGDYNTAIGFLSLAGNTTASDNTAIGVFAIMANTTGNSNTAVGAGALTQNTTGFANIAIGVNAAGAVSPTSDHNIHIGTGGSFDDNRTVRIGADTALGDPVAQTRFFASGIRGVTTGNPDAIPVVIDSNGQLGTASSSRRVKRDIEDMGNTTDTILALHPVRFRYTQHAPDSPLQYGLVAEEVAEIAPDLVARNKDGQIETVYYDKVNAMLLNEVQKLHRLNQKLEARLAELENRTK